eukprot:586261-Rhodomonas_salina.1
MMNCDAVMNAVLIVVKCKERKQGVSPCAMHIAATSARRRTFVFVCTMGRKGEDSRGKEQNSSGPEGSI